MKIKRIQSNFSVCHDKKLAMCIILTLNSLPKFITDICCPTDFSNHFLPFIFGLLP